MRGSQLIHRPQPRYAASGAVALDVSEALSGKFLNRRMQGVHARSIADERSYDTAAGVYIQAKWRERWGFSYFWSRLSSFAVWF